MKSGQYLISTENERRVLGNTKLILGPPRETVGLVGPNLAGVDTALSECP